MGLINLIQQRQLPVNAAQNTVKMYSLRIVRIKKKPLCVFDVKKVSSLLPTLFAALSSIRPGRHTPIQLQSASGRAVYRRAY